MSYSIGIKIRDGEVAEDVDLSGTIPDGNYSVSGHEDDYGHSFGASAAAPGGAQAAYASSFFRKTPPTVFLDDATNDQDE